MSSPRGLALIAVAVAESSVSSPAAFCSLTRNPKLSSADAGTLWAAGAAAGASAGAVGTTVVAGDDPDVAAGEAAPATAGRASPRKLADSARAQGGRHRRTASSPASRPASPTSAAPFHDWGRVDRGAARRRHLPAGDVMTCVRTASRPTARDSAPIALPARPRPRSRSSPRSTSSPRSWGSIRFELRTRNLVAEGDKRLDGKPWPPLGAAECLGAPARPPAVAGPGRASGRRGRRARDRRVARRVQPGLRHVPPGRRRRPHDRDRRRRHERRRVGLRGHRGRDLRPAGRPRAGRRLRHRRGAAGADLGPAEPR